MPRLEYVEGIGPSSATKLRAAGVTSTQHLFRLCCDRSGRAEIATRSGIAEKQILEWVNHIDLMRIRGVGSEYADLLEAAGVDSVPELCQRNSANLHAALVAANAEKRLVRQLPSEKQVADWCAQAKQLGRSVTH